jgi:hypothetical protein
VIAVMDTKAKIVRLTTEEAAVAAAVILFKYSIQVFLPTHCLATLISLLKAVVAIPSGIFY